MSDEGTEQIILKLHSRQMAQRLAFVALVKVLEQELDGVGERVASILEDAGDDANPNFQMALDELAGELSG